MEVKFGQNGYKQIEKKTWSHAMKMETCDQVIHINQEQSGDKPCFSFLFNVSERVFLKKKLR